MDMLLGGLELNSDVGTHLFSGAAGLLYRSESEESRLWIRCHNYVHTLVWKLRVADIDAVSFGRDGREHLALGELKMPLHPSSSSSTIHGHINT